LNKYYRFIGKIWPCSLSCFQDLMKIIGVGFSPNKSLFLLSILTCVYSRKSLSEDACAQHLCLLGEACIK